VYEEVFAERGAQPALPPEDHFQPGLLRRVTELAERLAVEGNRAEVAPAHLLLALGACDDAPTRAALADAGLDPEAVRRALEEPAGPDDGSAVLIGRPGYGPGARSAFDEAVRGAEEAGQAPAGGPHLLLALLGSWELSALLVRCGVDRAAAAEKVRARLPRSR
jgi:ATP-dependent Clp protease ATP-binding subunit ClpA